MAKVRLKFAQLVPQHPDDFGPPVDTVQDAINKGKVFRTGEALVLFFMDPQVRHIAGRDVLVTYFALAQGSTYRAPDPETGELVDFSYDSPPYKSRALVLIDSEGNVIVEAKKLHT